jgi:type IV secretory pathway VirJ component
MRAAFVPLAALVLGTALSGGPTAVAASHPGGPASAFPGAAPAGRPDTLKDLPLVEYPAAEDPSPWLVVHITGDGGVGVTDKGIGKTLCDSGVPIVELNSLKYFWTPRTPDGAAQDLTRILRHYLAAWDKQKVAIVGYSMGADVLPFLIDRLPADLRSRVGLVTFLGLAGEADFHIHLTGFVGVAGADALPVRPELEKLRGMDMMCFCGEHDGASICKDLPADLVRCTEMKGGHRVGGNYEGIAQAILADIGSQQSPLAEKSRPVVH